MSDNVLAAIPRSRLSIVLTAFHRNGYGHVVRVLDPDRAPIPDQLDRAGVASCRLRTMASADAVLLVVHAPKRTTPASALAFANGATDVEVVASGDLISAVVPSALIQTAETRRERRTGSRVPPIFNELTSSLAD